MWKNPIFSISRLDQRDETCLMARHRSIRYSGKCRGVTGKQGVRLTRLDVGSMSR